jgi:hypothetical protein
MLSTAPIPAIRCTCRPGLIPADSVHPDMAVRDGDARILSLPKVPGAILR